MTELGVKLPIYKPSVYDIYEKIESKHEKVPDSLDDLNPSERKLIQDLKILESIASELIQLDSENNHGEEAYKRYKVLIVAKSKLDELIANSSGYSMSFKDKLLIVNGKVNKIISRCKFMEKERQPVSMPFMQNDQTKVKNPFDDTSADDKDGFKFNPFDDFYNSSKTNSGNITDIKFTKKNKSESKADELRELNFGLNQPRYNPEEKSLNKHISKIDRPVNSFLSKEFVENYEFKKNKVENRDMNELFDIDTDKPSVNFDVDLI